MSSAIIVFAHGSRVESANQAVRSVAADLARAGGYPMVEAAFLELGHPSLEQAADLLVARGAAKLVIIPYFLTLGIHMERDLPRLVQSISLKHNGLKIAVTPPLDGHEGLVRILTDRAASALH